MEITLCESASELGRHAAEAGAERIRAALEERQRAVIALAAGTSQIATLAHLVEAPGVDWENVIVYPLSEFVGVSIKHPASFRHYLVERFVEALPAKLRAFHPIDGEASDPVTEAVRLSRLLSQDTIDVAFIGVGENGHIAFNDPPADFDSTEPYLLVELDEPCRRQQVHERWFASLEEVPEEAISMSVTQVLASRELICSVPELRKAEAVRAAVEDKISPQVPASILQRHEHCHLFLDEESASRLTRK